MTVPEEASDLWLFDSHKSSKRSPWLQSTLSEFFELTELEGKTKAMLKLIEGDADTFAQRAEMYYKKRPELISTIEDFYRAYRSLAERHDQLRLESGYALSNRGWLFKDWNNTDKSSESSSVVSEYMISEVDDPETEDDLVQVQVESKFTDVPKKSSSNSAIQTNEDMSGKFQGMLKDSVATNPMTAETEGNNSDASNITAHPTRKHSELVVRKPNESNSKDFLGMAKTSDSFGPLIEDGRIKSIAEESSESFTKSDSKKSKGSDSDTSNVTETVSKHSELVESKFTDVPKKSSSSSAIQTNEDMYGEFQGMLKDGVASNPLTAETEGINSDASNITTRTARKHAELVVHKPNESNSKDLLGMAKRSNSLGPLIEDGRIKSIVEESSESFTKSDSKKSKGSDSDTNNITETVSKHSEPVDKPKESNWKDFLERAKKSDPLSLLIEDGRIRSIVEESSESFTKSNSEESKGCDSDAINIIETASRRSELVLGEQNESNVKDFLEMATKSDPLSLLIEDGRIKSKAEESSEPFTKSDSKESKASIFHPLSLLIEDGRIKSKAEESSEPFTKSNSKESKASGPELDKAEDVLKLTSRVERLQEENVTFRCELERKDNEKREVIRQLSLSMDILREDNVCMRKFIKESKGSSGLFKFQDLKGVLRGKIFGGRSRYQTTLVAL